MALALDYPDAYLARFCTDDREARAFAEVDLISASKDLTYSTDWRNKCAQLKTYVLACLENQGAPDDLFASKLKSYQAEFTAAVARADSDANATAENTESALIFNIPLARA